jgi:hypothetical protein
MYFTTSNRGLSLSVAFGFWVGSLLGWGVWLGIVCDRATEVHKRDLLDFVLKIPNINLLNQARIALFLRGLLWMIPALLPFYFYLIVSFLSVISTSIILAMMWIVCCEVSRFLPITKMPSGAWEWQEILFGACQGLALIFIIGGYI